MSLRAACLLFSRRRWPLKRDASCLSGSVNLRTSAWTLRLKPHSPAKPLLRGLQNFAIRATGFNCFTFGCQIPNLQSKGCWIESDREVIVYLKRPFDAGIGPDWL